MGIVSLSYCIAEVIWFYYEIILASDVPTPGWTEGVETKTQVRFLKENGCTEIQGYFISKPLPASEIRRFLTPLLSSAQ